VTQYGPEFFARIDPLASASADRIVPLLLDHLAPTSVLDVGCGTGTWLSVFMRHGVTDVFGIDGDWVQDSTLQIPRELLSSGDVSKPLNLSRRFDLALCLEVGEHLPSRAAKGLVESLTAAAPVVLFSAAIPGQGGVDHVNEQWPEYWADLFAACGYHASDALRDQVWDDASLAWYYRQNMVVYFADAARRAAFDAALSRADRPQRRVHPDLLAHLRKTLVDPGRLTLRDLLAMARWTMVRQLKTAYRTKSS
jgi:SAM-dependent methyltransferase